MIIGAKMAKSTELKFSVGREERDLILIANFVDGYSSDFFFKLPTSFRDALDIKLTPRMIHGKTINIYSQGKNFSFKQGDVIHDTKEAYALEWGEALKYIKHSLQVIDSRDATSDIAETYEINNSQVKYLKVGESEKFINKNIVITKYSYDPGYVKFQLLQPNVIKEKLVEKSVYECSQENFVLFLQSGLLRTIDKQEIKLSKA